MSMRFDPGSDVPLPFRAAAPLSIVPRHSATTTTIAENQFIASSSMPPGGLYAARQPGDGLSSKAETAVASLIARSLSLFLRRYPYFFMQPPITVYRDTEFAISA